MSSAVGRAEVNHQAAVDRYGLQDPISIELGRIYLELLDGVGDARRHAERVSKLCTQIGARPQWMLKHRGGDSSYYTAQSDSVLARLASCSLLGDGGRLALRGGALRKDPFLCVERLASSSSPSSPSWSSSSGLLAEELVRLKRKWRGVLKEYKAAFARLRKEHEQARERAQLQSALTREAAPRRSGGGREGGGGGGGAAAADGEDEYWDRYFALVGRLREQYLLEPYAEERAKRPFAEPDGLLAEACVLYEVVFDAGAAQTTRESGASHDPEYHVAFAWHMAGDFLLHVLKARRCRAIDPSRALFSAM